MLLMHGTWRFVSCFLQVWEKGISKVKIQAGSMGFLIFTWEQLRSPQIKKQWGREHCSTKVGQEKNNNPKPIRGIPLLTPDYPRSHQMEDQQGLMQYTHPREIPLLTDKGSHVPQRTSVALMEKCFEGCLCHQDPHLHRRHWHSHLLEIWQQFDCGQWCTSDRPMHRQSPPRAHCPAGTVRSLISTNINNSQRQSGIFPACSETEHY